jgi:hypothetical protein
MYYFCIHIYIYKQIEFNSVLYNILLCKNINIAYTIYIDFINYVWEYDVGIAMYTTPDAPAVPEKLLGYAEFPPLPLLLVAACASIYLPAPPAQNNLVVVTAFIPLRLHVKPGPALEP